MMHCYILTTTQLRHDAHLGLFLGWLISAQIFHISTGWMDYETTGPWAQTCKRPPTPLKWHKSGHFAGEPGLSGVGALQHFMRITTRLEFYQKMWLQFFVFVFVSFRDILLSGACVGSNTAAGLQ